MINDFETVKKQLFELAEVINAFKSEAVQLRLVDLVLGGGHVSRQLHAAAGSEPEQHSEHHPQIHERRTRKGKAPSDEKKLRKGSKHTPAAILTELIAESFFAKSKTLNEIIDHASAHKARKMKPNELSGPLGRFTRDKKLSRKKNADGQYEYTAQ